MRKIVEAATGSIFDIQEFVPTLSMLTNKKFGTRFVNAHADVDNNAVVIVYFGDDKSSLEKTGKFIVGEIDNNYNASIESTDIKVNTYNLRELGIKTLGVCITVNCK